MEKKIAHYTYNLKDVLGKGSYSTVYKCINDHNNQVLAIKIIEKRLM
jgi:serine/threonine protein kinase